MAERDGKSQALLRNRGCWGFLYQKRTVQTQAGNKGLFNRETFHIKEGVARQTRVLGRARPTDRFSKMTALHPVFAFLFFPSFHFFLMN